MQTGSDAITVSAGVPAPNAIKKKGLIIVKAREEPNDPDENNPFPSGIENEVVFMEINRPILENLYSSCQVSLFFHTGLLSHNLA